MNDTGTVSEQVRDYVTRVAASLADLPPEVRADLVADLEQHLSEVAADSQQPLEESLGAPNAYAEELRISAGLDQPSADGSGASIVAAVQRLLDRVRRSPRMRGVLGVADELRPAWWVARGLAPAALIATLSFRSTRGVGWFLAGLVGVVVSVDVGRRQLQRLDARVAVTAANVAAAIMLLLVLLEFIQFGIPVRYETIVEEVPPRHLVHPGGEPITNIYAFDATGAPVTGIFLYDGAGKPIEIRRAAGELYGIQTDYERGSDGAPLRNFFPLRQYVQGVDELGMDRLQPRPEPRVVVPALAPPPSASEPATATTEPTAAPQAEPEPPRNQRRTR